MNLEEGTWRTEVTYERSDGETEHFPEGEPIGALLSGRRTALLEFPPTGRARVREAIDIEGAAEGLHCRTRGELYPACHQGRARPEPRLR